MQKALVLKCLGNELDGQVTRFDLRKIKEFSLLKSVQANFGPHPASNQRVEGLFFGGKRRGVEMTNEIYQILRFRMRGAKRVDPHMLQCL